MHISSDKAAMNSYLTAYGWEGLLSLQATEELKLYTFEPGETLFRGGETMEYFHFYVEGKSKVCRVLENGQVMLVRFYKPFKLMGDIELFTRSPAISTVIAISRVRCLRLPMETMRKEMEANTALLRILAEGLADKLARFNATSAVNMNYSLETRLASYLAMIYVDDETSRENRDELETENLGELSEFLGCSYRHLTRTLESFKTRGILEKKGRKIKILDPAELKRISKDVFQTETGISSDGSL